MLPYFFVYFNIFQFKDVLNYIVSIGIFDKDESVFGDLKHETHFLVIFSTIDALLHNTATMLVACNLHTLVDHSIIDELIELRLPCEQNFLNHMVSIYIFSKFFDSIFKKRREKLYMLGFLDNLYNLLNGSCAMGMSTKTHWIRFHVLNDLH